MHLAAQNTARYGAGSQESKVLQKQIIQSLLTAGANARSGWARKNRPGVHKERLAALVTVRRAAKTHVFPGLSSPANHAPQIMLNSMPTPEMTIPMICSAILARYGRENISRYRE